MSTLVGFGERLIQPHFSNILLKLIIRYMIEIASLFISFLQECLSILFTADTYVRDVLAYSFFDELFE